MTEVAGICRDWRQVDQVVADLAAIGLGPCRQRLIAGDPDSAYAAAPETGAEVPVGTVGGLGVGGVIGAAMGWLVDALDLLVLDLAEVWAAGPLAPALALAQPELAAGAGIGALAGGLLGAHAGWSFAEGHARAYKAQVAHGRIMLTVDAPTPTSAREAKRVLRRAGAQHVRTGVSRR